MAIRKEDVAIVAELSLMDRMWKVSIKDLPKDYSAERLGAYKAKVYWKGEFHKVMHIRKFYRWVESITEPFNPMHRR